MGASKWIFLVLEPLWPIIMMVDCLLSQLWRLEGFSLKDTCFTISKKNLTLIFYSYCFQTLSIFTSYLRTENKSWAAQAVKSQKWTEEQCNLTKFLLLPELLHPKSAWIYVSGPHSKMEVHIVRDVSVRSEANCGYWVSNRIYLMSSKYLDSSEVGYL